MKTVYKYEIDDGSVESTIKIPRNATILTAQCQYGRVKIWAFIDTNDNDIVEKKVYLVGTGNEVPSEKPLIYVSTLQTFAGTQVHHLFIEK